MFLMSATRATAEVHRSLLFGRLNTMQVTDQGGPSALPDCPSETNIVSSGNKPVMFQLHNLVRSAVHLNWVSFDGKEQTFESISGWSETHVSTFEGHWWRVRSSQGVLLAETKSYLGEFKVEPCKQMHGTDAMVLPPQLGQLAAMLQAPMARDWQDDALASALQECDPWRFLSTEEPFIGLHVLCLLSGGDGKQAAAAVFADGQWRQQPSALVPLDAAQTAGELIMLVLDALHLAKRAAHLQPSAFFTGDGQRMSDLQSVRTQRVALLYEGGQWIWPPIAMGHTWQVFANGHAVGQSSSTSSFTSSLWGSTQPDPNAGEWYGSRVALQIVTISLRPAAFEVRDFLRGDEAVHMQTKASPRMTSSGIANTDADRGKVMSDVRTSTMTFVGIDHDDRLKALARRVQCVSKVPATHMEAVQVPACPCMPNMACLTAPAKGAL